VSIRLKVRVRERWYTVEVQDLTESPVNVLVDGDSIEVDVERPSGNGVVETQADSAGKSTNQPAVAAQRPAAATRVFSSPMPGIIISVAVKEGDQVVTGDDICVLEAMKMQQTLKADWSGVVRTVHVREGQQVLDGDPLVELT